MVKPPYCQNIRCPLAYKGTGFSTPDGLGTSGVAIIGEALGHDEAIDSKPFRPKAQAGSKLEEIFRLGGYSREQFYLWNIIACQPPNNMLEWMPYEQGAIQACRRHFDMAMDRFKPPHKRVILALGNVALKSLVGVSGLAKEKQSILFLRGYVFNTRYGWVIPSYHPSFLKRGKPEFTPTLVNDLRKAVEVANGSYTDFPTNKLYKKPKYTEFPSLDELYSLYYRLQENSRIIISSDIETPNSRDIDEDERDNLEDADIIQVQFSIGRRTGYALPFKNGYEQIARKIYQLPNTKLGFNWWNFDAPRLAAKGVTVNGKVHDLMWMFKHYHPRLQRGLQAVASLFYFPFPWKHLMGTSLEFYGIADVDSLHWIWEKLPGLMKERGVWHGYQDMYHMHMILDKARERGLPVSDSKRLILEGELVTKRKEIDNELQEEIPDSLKNLSPRRKNKETGEVTFGYIREPPTIRQAINEYEYKARNLVRQGKRVITVATYIKRKLGLVKRGFTVTNSETKETTKIERWCKILPFKASKDQLVRYLRWRQRELLKEPDKRVVEEG